MILRGLPRWQGLAVVFAAHAVLALVIAPAFLAPALLEAASVKDAIAEVPGYWKWIFTLGWMDAEWGANFWTTVVAVVAWAGLATAFVAPLVGSAETGSKSRSLASSVVAAAVLGAAICSLLFATLVEGLIAAFSQDAAMFGAVYDRVEAAIWLGALGVWIVSGGVWFALLRRAGSSRDPAVLDRMLRALFAGTAVELVLGLPIYLMARKKIDCYCTTATFLNLVLGTTALLWLCGPWAILLATRSARRGWARGACAACGYPRRSGGTVCPECGNPLPE